MNDKQKNRALLVGFSLLFLVFIFISNRNNQASNENGGGIFGTKEEKKITLKNYAFTHIINDNIELSGKVYGTKTLTTKKEADVETVYFENGDKFYIKEDDKFVKFDGYMIEGIEHRYFDISFVESLLKDEEYYSIEDKTEDTMKIYHKKEDLYLTMYYDQNQDWYKMIIEKGDNKIETRFYDSNKVEDFDISVK